jgi:D-alanine-D-alanine ligase
MKIAVVYSSPNGHVFQHRGPVAHEVYSPRNVQRVCDALSTAGHETVKLESDRDLITGLERFFGPVPDGQWPGLVFNLAYGMQGRLRYCQTPGLLEMSGFPYLGSGPWGHALASDKAAAKAIFRDHGLPTSDFVVLHAAQFLPPDFGYPLVVKPIAEAGSYGVRLVENEAELKAAVAEDLGAFHQPVLVEKYLAGPEFNVSVLGNGPDAEALPPVEVVLEEAGPPIYTMEDKHGKATRKLQLLCPAQIPDVLAAELRHLALEAFAALRCLDWARVEFRLDGDGRPQLMEVNTLPGLGAQSSLPAAAAQAGMPDLSDIVQRLVDIAIARYQQESPNE